jgi:hypothetical protein
MRFYTLVVFHESIQLGSLINGLKIVLRVVANLKKNSWKCVDSALCRIARNFERKENRYNKCPQKFKVGKAAKISGLLIVQEGKSAKISGPLFLKKKYSKLWIQYTYGTVYGHNSQITVYTVSQFQPIVIPVGNCIKHSKNCIFFRWLSYQAIKVIAKYKFTNCNRVFKGIASRDGVSTETIGVLFRLKQSAVYLSYT